MKKSEALKILGLQDGASDDDIRKAHRKLIIANHPDKFGQDEVKRAAAEEKTKQINEARDVLISRKWDPEYSTTGRPYGAPYSYNPYAGTPANGQGSGGNPNDPFNGQNPFAGWPFPGATFVWTSWDATGKRTTHTYNPNSQQSSQTGSNNQGPNGSPNGAGFNPFGGAGRPNQTNPFGGFGGFSPLDAIFGARPLSPRELFDKAKEELRIGIIMFFIKAIILAFCAIFFTTAIGVYIYVFITLGQALYKRLRAFSGLVLLPFLLLILIFMPGMNTSVGVFGWGALLIALWFDFNNMYKNFQTYRTYRKQFKPEKKSKSKKKDEAPK